MPSQESVLPFLELIRRGRTERTFEIKASECHIGRSPGAEVSLEDGRVSRYHAKIERQSDGSYVLLDLQSQNETYLDGKKLTPFNRMPLHSGSRIKIVENELVFRLPALILGEDQEPSEVVGALDAPGSANLSRLSADPAKSLRAILDVVRALGGGGDIDELLGRALEGLMAAFPKADRGFIATAEADGSFPLRAIRGRDEIFRPPSLSRTIADQVFRRGKAVLIKDLFEDALYRTKDSICLESIRSAICVPLTGRDGSRLGMAQLDGHGGKAQFQEADLDLLAALALPIGVAVENDLLIRERATWSAAREIQHALLPRTRPSIPGYHFWECYRPAHEVGGDLYDYIPMESGVQGAEAARWVVTVGDVAGKGMPAALVMAAMRPEIRHLVRAGFTPTEVLVRANRDLYERGFDAMFATLMLVQIEPDVNRLTFACAGHNEPLLRRAGGAVERILSDGAGPPLGVIHDAPYGATSISLEVGDILVLYSDGVTEAMDQHHLQFGLGRLASVVGRPELSSVGSVGDAILSAVLNHSAGRSQSDDITLICFGRGPAAGS